MTFLTAGYIDGSRLSGEVLRRALWSATRGMTGVSNADSLKVQALGTPGAAVLVNAGGGVAQTKFAGAPPIQSYTVGNDSGVTLAVPASGGSASTWQVIVRVKDPQYAGESTPTEPLEDSYTVLELVSSVPAGKPYLWLATIVVPPSTATITNAMITDRRQIAEPRVRPDPPVTTATATASDFRGTGYETWPATSGAGTIQVVIPEWATKIVVRIDVNGILADQTSGGPPAYGGVRAFFNGIASPHSIVYASNLPTRIGVCGAWTFDIPAAWRGSTRPVSVQAMKSSPGNNYLRADQQTQLIWSITWHEAL